MKRTIVWLKDRLFKIDAVEFDFKQGDEIEVFADPLRHEIWYRERDLAKEAREGADFNFMV